MKKFLTILILVCMLMGLAACNFNDNDKPTDQWNQFGNDDEWLHEGEDELPPLEQNLKASQVLQKVYDAWQKLDYYHYHVDIYNNVTTTVGEAEPQIKQNKLAIDLYRQNNGVAQIYDAEIDGRKLSNRMTAYLPYLETSVDYTPLYTQLADTRIDSAVPIYLEEAEAKLAFYDELGGLVKKIAERDWGNNMSLVYKNDEYILVFPFNEIAQLAKEENTKLYKEIHVFFEKMNVNDDIVLFKVHCDSLFRVRSARIDKMYAAEKSEAAQFTQNTELSFEMKSVEFKKESDQFFKSLYKSVVAFNKTNGIMMFVPKDIQTFKNLSAAQEILYKGYVNLEKAKSYTVTVDVSVQPESSSKVTNLHAVAEKQTNLETDISVVSFESNLSGRDVIQRSYSVASPLYKERSFWSLEFVKTEAREEFVADLAKITDPRRIDYKITEPALQFMLNDLGDSVSMSASADGGVLISMDFNKFYNIANSTNDNIFKDIFQAKEIKNLTRTTGTVVIEFDKEGRVIKISMEPTRLGVTRYADKYILSFTCTFTNYDNVPYTLRSDLQSALDVYNADKNTNYELPAENGSISDVMQDENEGMTPLE